MNSRKQRILVVDDAISNIQVLGAVLKPEYEVLIALNGQRALKIAESETRPDLILMDIKMPEMDGLTVCRRLKEQPLTREIPIIFVSASGDEQDEILGLAAGGADFVTKPIHAPIILARVKTHLLLHDQKRLLGEMVREKTADVSKTLENALFSLSALVESRDQSIGNHLRKTQEYMMVLANHVRTGSTMGASMSDEYLAALQQAVPLHDVGKVIIPDSILLKPGKLSSQEFDSVKTHTTIGRDAIVCGMGHAIDGKSSQFQRIAGEIAYSHHERWDGSGYPEGLKGLDIPFPARMMAICDVYDAMVSKRVYKNPIPHEDAVAMIRNERGKQFDPELADAFLLLEEKFLRIANEYATPGQEQDSLMESMVKRGFQ